MKDKPRYIDFWNIGKDMTAEELTDFICWCWSQKLIPNPKIMEKWFSSRS